ncbi:MAG TPA: hypothetical protein VFG78_12095 [Gemmatimonadota bacterium]|nr:hypothetical protein [Gemmatimonadota bacterium]
MKKVTTALTTMTLALAACSARTDSQVATTTEMGTTETGPALLSWEVALLPNAGYDMAGEASVRDLGENGTRVAVEVRDGEPGTTHPWHLHEGECDSGGGIVGAAAAYEALVLNQDGEASGAANIELRLDPDVDYHVNVHKSPSETDTIIACGELREN